MHAYPDRDLNLMGGSDFNRTLSSFDLEFDECAGAAVKQDFIDSLVDTILL